MEAQPVMPHLHELHLFDSCVTLGRFVGGPCLVSAADLLTIMDRYAIAEALVHEYHARGVYPIAHGNRRLLALIHQHPRLHPVWVLEPPVQPGRPVAELLVSEMLSSGVRAARLRLRAKGALPWLWEDLCAVLEAHGVPCFFDFGTPESTLGELSDNDVDAVRIIAHKHPRLPIILSHVMGGIGIHPAISYLMRRLSNLYLDITGLLEYWRTVANDIGAERVLFATGMPFTDPGILVSNIQYTVGLDTAAKQLLCGGNMRRLLGGVR